MQYHDPKASVTINTFENIDSQFDYKVLEQQKRDRDRNKPDDPYAKFNDPEFIKKLNETNQKVEKEYDPVKLAKENKEREDARRLQKELNDPYKERNDRTIRITNLINNLAGGKLDAERKVVHVPQHTVLLSEFGTKFKENVSASRRAKKIKNKKSRLFAKDKNYNRICNVSNEMTKRKFLAMQSAMKGRSLGCDQETFHDLSAFLNLQLGEDENAKLLNDYLGTSKNYETGEIQGQNRKAALEYIIKRLFSIDIHNISFENDTEMVKSAYKLENIADCVGAFDRIIQKNTQFFTQDISTGLKNKIFARLDELRAVSAYYLSRKELLSDETFRTHYDDELSMEINEKSTDEQRAVAEKLMKSYILGRNLIRVNTGGQVIMDNALYLDMHFRNERSNQLFQRALELESKDEQKKYLEKAYTSMDYLAGGIRLNANDLRLKELPTGLNNNLLQAGNGVTRDDVDAIKDKLRDRGINVSIEDQAKMINPITGEVQDSLGITRMLEGLPKRATASYGTDDIVNMFYNLFAPTKEENQNLPDNSPQKQELIQNFKNAFATYKDMQLGTLRSYMNTFGNIPLQLTAEDNKKLLYTHGNIINEYQVLIQDMNLVYDMDKSGELFNVTENSRDNELLYRNSFVSKATNVLSTTANQANLMLMDEDEQQQPEDMVLTNLKASIEDDKMFSTENYEKNRFVTGPGMTKSQLKKYSDQAKKTLSPVEYDNYTKRRKACTDTTAQILKYWAADKIPWFMESVGNGTVLEQKDLKKKALLQLRTLDALKKSPVWNDPNLVKNAETRIKIVLAKENENYIKTVLKAIDYAIEYITLKERLKKDNNLDDQAVNTRPEVIEAKAKMDRLKNGVSYVSNVYVAYARENALKEVQIEQDVDYTQAAYETALRDFNALDYRNVKFGSWGDIIKNYHHNLALCRRAEKFQNLLGEAILNGKNFTDKFLIAARAKLRFFNEVKKTCIYANNKAITDPGFCSMEAENIRSQAEIDFNGNSNEYRRHAFPTRDIKALYNSYVRDVKNEHNDRENLIVKAYYGFSPNHYDSFTVYYNRYFENRAADPDDTISDAEVTARKSQYQKNAMLADYFSRLNESFNQSTSANDAAVEAYCKRNGIEKEAFTRTESNMMAFVSPSKAIEIYKLFTGSNEDKMKLYLQEIDEANKCAFADFQMGNFAKLFKGSTIKQRVKSALIGTCLEGVGSKMAEIIKDADDPLKAGRADLVDIPKGYTSIADIKSKTLFFQNIYYNYVGRFTGLLQMGEHKYRGAMSIEDMNNMDPQLAGRREYQGDYVTADELHLQDNIKSAEILIPIHGYEKNLPEAQQSRARFGDDMDMIYLKELKYHINNQNRPQQGAQGNNVN